METKPDTKYNGHVLIDFDAQLKFIDKIRLLFGSRLYVQAQLHTQFRIGNHEVKNFCGVEVWNKRMILNAKRAAFRFNAWLKRNARHQEA